MFNMKERRIISAALVPATLLVCACRKGEPNTARRAWTGNPASALRLHRGWPKAAAALEELGAGKLLSAARADLDGDGRMETVALTCKTFQDGHPMHGEIVVLVEDGPSLRPSLRPAFRARNLNPWKVLLADVDGEAGIEVVVGVYKKSRFDPVMARRLFVYNWNGRRLLPKWLGSRLSRRFVDFAVDDVDRDGHNELVALEEGRPANASQRTANASQRTANVILRPANVRRRAAVYRWRSFGFDWVGCTAEMEGMETLAVSKGKISVRGQRGAGCILTFSGMKQERTHEVHRPPTGGSFTCLVEK